MYSRSTQEALAAAEDSCNVRSDDVKRRICKISVGALAAAEFFWYVRGDNADMDAQDEPKATHKNHAPIEAKHKQQAHNPTSVHNSRDVRPPPPPPPNS